MLLIDTHNHLGCARFDQDRIQVVNASLALGVRRQIVIGVFSYEWLSLLQLAKQYPCIYIGCGIHPLYIPEPEQLKHILSYLEQLLKADISSSKLCALGEIGLDYFIESPDKPYQTKVFLSQLELAISYQRPVLLHVRRAHADTIKLLKQLKFKECGIVHAFSGSYEEAKEYIKLGFKIGLGGAATYPQAKRMHQVIQQLPLSSIVLETDAPDLSPVNHQGKRNSPEYLPEICQQLATIKGILAEELATISSNNCCELFGWDSTQL